MSARAKYYVVFVMLAANLMAGCPSGESIPAGKYTGWYQITFGNPNFNPINCFKKGVDDAGVRGLLKHDLENNLELSGMKLVLTGAVDSDDKFSLFGKEQKEGGFNYTEYWTGQFIPGGFAGERKYHVTSHAGTICIFTLPFEGKLVEHAG